VKNFFIPVALPLLVCMLGCAPRPLVVEDGPVDPYRPLPSAQSVLGFELPGAKLPGRKRLGEPASRRPDQVAHDTAYQPVASQVPSGEFGCADLREGDELAALSGASQHLVGALVLAVCGTWDFASVGWAGGKCASACTGPSEWCSAWSEGVVVEASLPCNMCATTLPPDGALDAIQACATDPSNGRP